jgi:L-threonylcarbamoyladenylate synthase
MTARVLPTHTPALFATAVAEAAARLAAGELVVLPTETVYGLAANALNASAVGKIFAAKRRPPENPIIVHVASHDLARRCTSAWPATADVLSAAFWPGPLTLVLPRAPDLPALVVAGAETVGVRWPSHPFAQAVIRHCGFPLAAPSANLSGHLSPTSAAHIPTALAEHASLIVDGGPCVVGIESTVLDLTGPAPCILRPGIIHAASLAAALGIQLDAATPDTGPPPQPHAALRSPGLLPKHYAPRTRLAVLAWTDSAGLERQLRQLGATPNRSYIIAHSQIPAPADFGDVCVVPHDAEAYARALYAELHRADAAAMEIIIVERPPAAPAWQAIHDRLARASA